MSEDIDICEHGVDMVECPDCERWAEAFFAEWLRDIDLGDEDEPLP